MFHDMKLNNFSTWAAVCLLAIVRPTGSTGHSLGSPSAIQQHDDNTNERELLYTHRNHRARNHGGLRESLKKHDFLKDWRDQLRSTPTTEATSTPPTDTAAPRVCEPTLGLCVEGESDLRKALDTTDKNTIVAICPATTLSLTSRIEISAPSVTLCCQGGTNDCRIQLLGETTSLVVTGESFTLSNITLTGGGYGYPATQLTITSNGTHTIDGCGFYHDPNVGGQGMLYINTLGDVVIRNSVFAHGYAGLSITNAATMTIQSTEFRNNSHYGLLTEFQPPRSLDTDGQILRIANSAFVENQGTGILSSNLGLLPRLSILETEFSGNGQEPYYGTAGTFCCPESYGEINFRGNFGTQNDRPNEDGDTCNGFFFWEYPILEGDIVGTEMTYCVGVDEDISGNLV